MREGGLGTYEDPARAAFERGGLASAGRLLLRGETPLDGGGDVGSFAARGEAIGLAPFAVGWCEPSVAAGSAEVWLVAGCARPKEVALAPSLKNAAHAASHWGWNRAEIGRDCARGTSDAKGKSTSNGGWVSGGKSAGRCVRVRTRECVRACVRACWGLWLAGSAEDPRTALLVAAAATPGAGRSAAEPQHSHNRRNASVW